MSEKFLKTLFLLCLILFSKVHLQPSEAHVHSKPHDGYNDHFFCVLISMSKSILQYPFDTVLFNGEEPCGNTVLE